MAFITIYNHGDCKRYVIDLFFFKLQFIVVNEEVYQEIKREYESLLE